jgi:hypothetical protein
MTAKIQKNGLLNTLLAKINGLLVFFVVYFIYLLTVFPTVQTEDSGELITSAVKLDIAHPPGYPLFILVGKIFSTLLPFGNMAWRINVMSAFFGALTAQIIYVILKKKTRNELIAFGMAILYAFSNVIWGQSNRAEVYTLNTFCISLVIYLLMRWSGSDLPNTIDRNHGDEEKGSKWLFLAALVFGLGVADHHTILLTAPAIGIFVLIKNWRTVINPKILAGCIGLLLVGISVYAYIPIRTYVAPYDNPAFIDHSGLYTWPKFINFINRSIYGGTVAVPVAQATQEAAVQHLPTWVLDISDFFTRYGSQYLQNNAKSLVPLLKIIFLNFYFIPLFFILPGIYYSLKKDWKWGLLLILLFVCCTTLLNVFTPIDSDINDLLAFNTQPFMMPAIIALTLLTGEGLAWFRDNITDKQLAMGFAIMCIVPGAFALGKNFPSNDESANFIAYDFNKLTLASVPQNGYLLSVGRDNMTFPLYYLREVENYRSDVHLEIYYSTSPVSQDFLQTRLVQNGGNPVYIDLLPPDYASIGLRPYNFIYEYGGNPATPAPSITNPQLRGVRDDMDFPNTRLEMLYYIKMGIAEKDPLKQAADFDHVINASGDNGYYINIIGDYSFLAGDYAMAQKAYTKAENGWGLQKTTDKINNPASAEDEDMQTGMM